MFEEALVSHDLVDRHLCTIISSRKLEDKCLKSINIAVLFTGKNLHIYILDGSRIGGNVSKISIFLFAK